MNRKFSVIIVVLFALAALEFGVLGARAAGISGNDSPTLPPVAERGRPRTATPAPQRQPAAIQLGADRLAVDCDQGGPARVSVKLFDAAGRTVPDGTYVTFNVDDGYANPWEAYTSHGAVSSEIHVFGDFTFAPNVVVDAGDLEGGIRIRCNPRGGDCSISPPSASPPCPTATPSPSSPPQCAISPPSVSPPCSTPVPPSPPPCNPSPGAGPMSPPCTTPTLPPCGDGITSPPAISPPCATSTPSPTATPAGPTDYTFAVDCDVNATGVQDACTIPPGTTALDVDLVLENNSATTATLGAFNFNVHDSDTSLLNPGPGTNSNLDGNPDFNQAAMTGAWTCTPPPPTADTGADGPGRAVSLLSCFTGGGPGLPTVAPGGHIAVARVHYAIPAGATSGTASLTITDFAVADGSPNFYELGSCNPDITVIANCFGATVTFEQLETPVAVSPPSACADVNGDSRIDATDVLLITQHTGKGHYNVTYDINHDGRIDATDLLIAAKQRGGHC
jgi:hypothetical protein